MYPLKSKLRDCLAQAVNCYGEHAGRPYDPENGYAQIPEGNIRAAIELGRIWAYREALNLD